MNVTAACDRLNKIVATWPAMDRPNIRPTLCRLSNIPYKWRLRLVEEWQNDYDSHHRCSGKLDSCVKWVDEKLEDWPSCKRMAWDMWDFKHRKDAEKFITVFHLSWQQ